MRQLQRWLVYAFLTILQSATLEIGPPHPPRTRHISAFVSSDQKFDSDDVPFYDSNPSTRVTGQGIIFIIFFFGWIVQQVQPLQRDCIQLRRRCHQRSQRAEHDSQTVPDRNDRTSTDEVNARPRPTSSLSQLAYLRFHSYRRDARLTLFCHSSGLIFPLPLYLTTA